MLTLGGLPCLCERKCLNSMRTCVGLILATLSVKYIVEPVVELWFRYRTLCLCVKWMILRMARKKVLQVSLVTKVSLRLTRWMIVVGMLLG